MKAKLTSLGAYAPKKVVTNQDMEAMIETSDEWIVKRTGIRERRYTEDDEYVVDICYHAALQMKEKHKLDYEDVDFILVATITSGLSMPSVASQLQHLLGIKRAGSLDLAAACAGFVYGLVTAKGLIATGDYKKILVFGAETISKVLDYSDRTTCVLFGDGAGVAMVEAAEEGNILSTITGTEGEGGPDLYLSSWNNQLNGTHIEANGKLHQTGKRVFKWAVSTATREIERLLEKENITINDVDWFVPHSANQRILDVVCENLGFPLEKTLESLSYFGNTSSATIPLALASAAESGKLKSGDKLALIGFGGGLTYAGTILIWP
ncbi:MAG: beta-ketoacyl-ACP synthase III [Bacteroidota bacterium]